MGPGKLYSIAGRGEQVILPRGSKVVRLVFGDSIGQLNMTRELLSQQSMRGNKADTEVVYRPNARYFSKYFHNAGTAEAPDWVVTERALTAGEATYNFEPLNDHVGLTAPSDAADLGSAVDLDLMWLLDVWSDEYCGTYIDQDGQEIGIDYIRCGVAGVSVGDTGNGATTFAPSVPATGVEYANGRYELLIDHYAKAGINLLRAEAAAELASNRRYNGDGNPTVFVESMLFTAGGYDANDAGRAAIVGASLQRIINAVERDLAGKIPTVLVRPYETGSSTFVEADAAIASFDAQFDEFGDGPVDWIRMEGCAFYEELEVGVSEVARIFPGIHPLPDGASLMARRICDALNRMAVRGQTMLPITADLS
jgi:hypothetical protein